MIRIFGVGSRITTKVITRPVFQELKKKIKGHWHYVNPLDSAFNQQYSVLKSQHHSGWSEDNLKSGAHDKYEAIYKTNFKNKHVWKLVKSESKWKPSTTSSASVASRSSSNAQSPINLEDNEDKDRPIGTNRALNAKGKATSSSTSSNSRLDDILEKHVEENMKVCERYQISLDAKNALK